MNFQIWVTMLSQNVITKFYIIFQKAQSHTYQRCSASFLLALQNHKKDHLAWQLIFLQLLIFPAELTLLSYIKGPVGIL